VDGDYKGLGGPMSRDGREVISCIFCGIIREKSLYSKCAKDAKRFKFLKLVPGVKTWHMWTVAKVINWNLMGKSIPQTLKALRPGQGRGVTK
jgi:hypothetical protein